MPESSIWRTILPASPQQRIVLFRTAWSAVILQSVMVPYFLWKGLTIAEVLFVQGIFGVLLSILDVPGGIVADTLGRKNTLILAAVLRGVGATGLVLLSGYEGMLLAYSLIAFGNSLMSGADVALLYEVDRDRSPAHSKSKYLAILHQRTFITFCVTGIVGSFLAHYSMMLAGMVSMVVAWVAFPCTLLLPKATHERPRPTARLHLADLRRHFGADARQTGTVLFFGVFNGSCLIFLYCYPIVWSKLELPLPYFGYLFAAQSIVSAFAAKPLARARTSLGIKTPVAIICLLTILGFTAVFSESLVFISIVFILLGVVRAALATVVMDVINHRAPDQIRAAVNSVGTLLSRIFSALISIWLGVGTNAENLGVQFLILGATIAIISCASIYFTQAKFRVDAINSA